MPQMTLEEARKDAAQHGLYTPQAEHDACGVGFVANIKGRVSHKVIEDALLILHNLDHRGAVGADPLCGDYRLIVLAPASVQEMHDFVALGFDLAFKYRNPAMILADGAIGQMMEKVVLAPQRPRKTNEEIAAECRDWATYGKPADRPRNVVTSLELQSEAMEKINLRLQAKYKAMEENEVRYEALACDDADYVIVAFGSSARICSATVEMARAEGIRLGMLRPITLYPFPTRPIAELAARVKGFLSVELNAGQMVEDVRLAVNGAVPVEHYGRQGGMIYSPDEVLAALKEKLIKA